MTMAGRNWRWFASLAALWMVAPNVQAEELFPDKNLEAAVRKYVFAKRDNDQPITAEDVGSISTIVAKDQGIKNLKGLEACKSLALLDLEKNEVADLAPIKDLKRIQSLTLAGNKIQDLKPLEGLTALQYLQLEDNQVADLAPLAKLVNLNALYLSGNKIKDAGPLAELKKLASLYLGDNEIEDIGPLAKLTRVMTLSLRGNRLTDLSALSDYTDLRLLFLENNKLADLSTLVEMARRDTAGDHRFAPFWRIYLAGNPLSDDAKNKQLAELAKLGARINLGEKQAK